MFILGEQGVGGDEANRGGQRHPGAIVSSGLTEAGHPQHEELLLLNVEMCVELRRTPAAGSCFLTLAHAGLEVNPSIAGETSLAGGTI